MTRRPTDVHAQLDALYAELPTIDCRGQCHDSCGPIAMTKPERRRIGDRGHEIHTVNGPNGPLTCSALTILKRCAVYDIRPMICRIWGLARGIQCSYGCVPDGGYLTDAQAYELLARAADIVGDTAQATRFRRVAIVPNLEHHLREGRRGTTELADAERRWNGTRT